MENRRNQMENRRIMYLLLKIIGESWKIIESCTYYFKYDVLIYEFNNFHVVAL